MKNKSFLKFFSILLVANILFTSCVSSTLIQSYPSGAKVYIDGEPTGVTPYWHTDSKITGSITNIDLVKEGYEPLYTSIRRTEQVNVGAMLGGFLVWPIFLWTMDYNPTHNYDLEPLHYQSNVDSTGLTNTQTAEKQAPVQVVSPKIQRLRELKQMLDENVITKEDFEKQKQKILDEK